MSRSGYTEDYECDSREAQWAQICHRGAVMSAIRGKKGQTFLKELVATLDAMPEKKLIADELVTPSGEVCAIGSVMVARGLDATGIDTYDYEAIAAALGINQKIVQEIEWENDQAAYYSNGEGQAEKRWQSVRDWAVAHIKPEASAIPQAT